MNIIALSLGLIQPPPRPAAAVGRLHYTPHERDDEEKEPRMKARSASEHHTRIINTLRETGPGTTSDLAVAHKTTPRVMRATMLRLAERGLVTCETIDLGGGRVAYLWSVKEAPDA